MDAMDPQVEKYLCELFQRTQGRMDAQVSMFDIGAVMGLAKDEARRTAEDLIAEGLVEIKTLSGAIGITPQGIEMAQKTGGADDGADLALGDDPILEDQGRHALNTVLTAIKDHLSKTPTPFSRLEEMVIDMKTIEVQLLSPRPKTAIIRTILRSMREGLQRTHASTLADHLDKITGD